MVTHGKIFYNNRPRFKNHCPLVKHEFLNYDKTAIILHSRKENTLSSSKFVTQHGKSCDKNNMCSCQKTQIVKKIKYLGIKMCPDMKWKEQIPIVSNKVKK